MKKIFLFLLLSFSIIHLCFSSVASVGKILMITDSHGEGTFGAGVARLTEEAKGNISVYSVGGSTPRDWLLGQQQIWGYWVHHTHGETRRGDKPVTPQIDDLLDKENPDVVVVELGTNLLWNPLTKKETNEILLLVSKITQSGRKCIWIGPPGHRLDTVEGNNLSEKQKAEILKARQQSVDELQKFLKENLPSAHCDIYPSWESIHYPGTGGDGIHYDKAGKAGVDKANQWVREASTFINDHISKKVPPTEKEKSVLSLVDEGLKSVKAIGPKKDCLPELK